MASPEPEVTLLGGVFTGAKAGTWLPAITLVDGQSNGAAKQMAAAVRPGSVA